MTEDDLNVPFEHQPLKLELSEPYTDQKVTVPAEKVTFFNGFAHLDVTVGTAGPTGQSPPKYGARSAVVLEDQGSFTLHVKLDNDEPVEVGSVTLVAVGDAEHFTLIKALRWAADRLEAMPKEPELLL